MDAVVLYPGIGTSQDAPDENGSLHAKIAELRAYINTELAKVQKPRAVHGVPGFFGTGESSFQTALNVNGKGKLIALRCRTNSQSGAYIQITIDGTAVGFGNVGVSGATWWYPTKAFLFTTSNNSTDINFSADGDPNVEMSYKTSLKIEIAAMQTGQSIFVGWQYEHE
jgi:hypothetical protein